MKEIIEKCPVTRCEAPIFGTEKIYHSRIAIVNGEPCVYEEDETTTRWHVYCTSGHNITLSELKPHEPA